MPDIIVELLSHEMPADDQPASADGVMGRTFKPHENLWGTSHTMFIRYLENELRKEGKIKEAEKVGRDKQGKEKSKETRENGRS